jgi:hypothetical protein
MGWVNSGGNGVVTVKWAVRKQGTPHVLLVWQVPPGPFQLLPCFEAAQGPHQMWLPDLGLSSFQNQKPK